MRILAITPTYFPVVGGAEVGLYEIYRRLAQRHEVKLLTPRLPRKLRRESGIAGEFYEPASFAVQHFHDWFTFAKTPLKNLWGYFLPPVSFSYCWSVWRELRDFKPDVIHINFIVPAGLALLAVRRWSTVPVVLSLIGRSDVLRSENPYFRRQPRFCRSVLQRATRATALTEYMLGDMPQPPHLQIIPYGTDTERFNPDRHDQNLRRKLNIPDQAPLLFTAGRLVTEKQIDFLIRTMRCLTEKNPHAVLLVAGQGPQLTALQQLVAQLELEQNVRFCGFVPEQELPVYYATADLFLMASAQETFGLVLAQALASGTPVVALGSSCVPEVIQHNENGILLDSADPDRFAAAVAGLLADDARCQKLSANARRSAVEQYAWDAIVPRYEQVLVEAHTANA